MSFIARWCFRHKLAVIAAWVLALIALTALAQAVKAEYNNSFSLPGTGSTTAQQLLASSVPARSGDSDTIVWRVGTGTVRDPAVMTRMSAALTQIATFPEVASVISPYGPGGTAQISRDDRTGYAVVNFTKQSGNLAKADVGRVIDAAQAAREPGLDVQLGGQAIEKQPPLSLGTVVGVLAAAIVLFIAFGSLIATLLPLITALAGVAGGLMAIAPLTHSMSIVTIAPIIAALIGLGVGIDYALFIVTRYRRGLEAGLTPEEAAVTALNTSGRTVLFAGGTVCIALLGILVLNFGFLNGLAIACALTVLLTVLATITVLPALFSLFGRRVLSGGSAARWARSRGRPAGGAGGGRRVGEVGGHRAAAPGGAGRGCRRGHAGPRHPPVAAPVRQLRPGPRPCLNHHQAGLRPAGPGLRAGFQRAAGAGRAGQFAGRRGRAPRAGSAPAAPGGRRQRRRGRARVRDDRHPADAAHVTGGTRHHRADHHFAHHHDPGGRARDDAVGIRRRPERHERRLHLGGRGQAPGCLLTIIGLSFLLLVIAFRSLLIPATAAVMNLLAAAATFGVMTALFQWGWGIGAFGLGMPGRSSRSCRC